MPKKYATATLSSTWTLFRGNTRQHGVTNDRLPDSLTLLWSTDIEGECGSAPVIDTQQVYIGSTDGKIYALGKSDGAIKWQCPTNGSIEAAPLCAFGHVYIGDKDGIFYSINRENGVIAWACTTDGGFVSAANVLHRQDPMLLVGNHNDTLYAFDTSGVPVWKYASDSYINGTPATDGKRIVFGGCDEYLHVLDADNGTLLNKINVGAYVAGSVVLDNNHIWAGLYNGKAICIDIDSMVIVWEFQPKKNSDPFYASPAVTQNQVIASCYDGFFYCLSRDNGSLLWKCVTKEQINSAPVAGKQRIVAGSDDGRLYIIDRESGMIIDSYDTGGAVGSPAVGGGLIVVGDDNGRVHAFAAPPAG